jgi:hypothetical protein
MPGSCWLLASDSESAQYVLQLAHTVAESAWRLQNNHDSALSLPGFSRTLRGASQLFLALPVAAQTSSLVVLSVAADDLRLVTNRSPGNITAAQVLPASRFLRWSHCATAGDQPVIGPRYGSSGASCPLHPVLAARRCAGAGLLLEAERQLHEVQLLTCACCHTCQPVPWYS